MFEAETWVAVALLIFLGLLGYLGVHKTILTALDARGRKIEADLSEAKRLREEAQAIVADYKKRQAAAEQEAKQIIAAAKEDAERLAAEAKAKMEEFVARRTRMAEAKIAQAEAQAVADVRAAAADIATLAAGTVLGNLAKGSGGDALIKSGIDEVKAKLN